MDVTYYAIGRGFERPRALPLFITSEQSGSQQTEFPTGRLWRKAVVHYPVGY